MITAREKARLNQMLMSGDIKNIELAFEIIMNLEKELMWIILRAKDRLIGMEAFFAEKCMDLEDLIEDRIIEDGMNKDSDEDLQEYYKKAEIYRKKLDDITQKCHTFLDFFKEKMPSLLKSEGELKI